MAGGSLLYRLRLTESVLHLLRGNVGFVLWSIAELALGFFARRPPPMVFTLVSSLKQHEALGFEFHCLCLFYCDVNVKKTIIGQIPTKLLQLTKLVSLDLSSLDLTPGNSLSTDESFLRLLSQKLRNIRELDMSNADISSKIPHELSNMSYLRFLNLRRCNLFGESPTSVLLIPNLQSIRLGGNPNLRGKLPVFHENNSLQELSIAKHHFQFTGFLPKNISQLSKLETFWADENSFVGPLPSSIFKIFSLTEIELEDNQFSDLFGIENITLLPNLEVFRIGNNNFKVSPVDLTIFSPLKSLTQLSLSGIPLSTSNITHDFPSYLEQLYLSGCNVTEFPEFIRNQRNLLILEIPNNKIKGQVPDWLWRLPMLFDYLGYDGLYYDSIVLPSKGIEMEMERILTIYTAIDFSGNKFHGQILESVGLLKDLHILNLSRNAFTGHIPSSFANLTALESLDISQNQLSGEIPPKLGDLSSLEWINVSYNQLVGLIPQGTQFQRQNCSSYEGNPGLYGPSLKDICGDINAPASPKSKPEEPKDEEEEEEEEEEEGWLSWTAAWIGFASGVVFGLTMGYIMASHKHEWFKKTFGRNKHRRTRNR
ncbi:hypothetical protein DY000_02013378 [Brassica cretica]|uniref:Leucine-rich repeat-containing N-terminal plant-type domain-containing protein n=1 Tax=Brassica cretica TaxID=69181 RepID=A0ABQ7CWR8_BRACR|nr:hypothetical protein DY000_02013378 [Brassica cretica]